MVLVWYGEKSQKRFDTTSKMRTYFIQLTLFDALDLLVIDGTDRHAAPEDVANMMSRDVFRLLHDVAVPAVRAHMKDGFGTGQDGGTDSEAIADVGGGAKLKRVTMSQDPAIGSKSTYSLEQNPEESRKKGNAQNLAAWCCLQSTSDKVTASVSLQSNHSQRRPQCRIATATTTARGATQTAFLVPARRCAP